MTEYFGYGLLFGICILITVFLLLNRKFSDKVLKGIPLFVIIALFLLYNAYTGNEFFINFFSEVG